MFWRVSHVSRFTRHVLLLTADLTGLAGLAADALTLEQDAFAQVGFRLLELAYAGRFRADYLLVDACHVEARRGLDVEGDAGGGLYAHGVREAERENKRLALLRDAVADAGDLERLGEAVRHARHHIGD